MTTRPAPLDTAADLTDLLTTVTPAEAAAAAALLRLVAELDAPDPPNMRARDRLLGWADALETAA